MQLRKIESPKISNSHNLLFFLRKPGLLADYQKHFFQGTYAYHIKFYFLYALKHGYSIFFYNGANYLFKNI